jgi:hypothetical protein
MGREQGVSAARLRPRRADEPGTEQRVDMSTWAWVIVAFAGFVLLSAVVTLLLGAILGQIDRHDASELEAELWASAPVRREDAAEKAPRRRAALMERVGARRSHR